MIRSLPAILTLVLVSQSPGAEQRPGPITIIANPGALGSIETAATGEDKVDFWDDKPADDAACTESFAAVELRRFLTPCLGVAKEDIRFAAPVSLPATGDVVLLGSRDTNPLIGSVEPQPAGVSLPKTPGSFRLHSFPRDGRTIVIIEGTDRVGTLYGAYAFLEYLGMRFFGLGEPGTVYPPAPVRIPQDLNLVEEPKFLARGFMGGSPRGNEPFFLWMARNRMNLWIASEPNTAFLKKLGLFLTEGGHAIQDACLGPRSEYPYNQPKHEGDESKPADPYAVSSDFAGDKNKDGHLSYGEAHPEWYALRGGKRQVRPDQPIRDNFCTSNRDAVKELARNLIQSLIDGPYRYADVLDFWMLDHGPWCECEPCRRQGSCTDRMLLLQHQVCQEMKAARQQGRLKRPVELRALAYLETLPPPTRPLPEDFDYSLCSMTFFPISRCYAHPLADPQCQEINRHTCKCYQDWVNGFFKGSFCIGEYYNVSSIKTLPALYTRIMPSDIPWYYQHGARHFHYMHTPTSLWGTWTLNQRLLARLLWNPATDAGALLDDYFRLYYPTTATRTRRFYEHLQDATLNIKAFKHHVWVGDNVYHCLMGKLNEKEPNLFPMQHLHYEPFHPPINDAPDVVEMIRDMQLAREEINDALLECRDDKEQARLLDDERRFAYGEAMYLFIYHLVRISTFDRQGRVDLARHEFEALDRQATRLRGIVDLVQVAFRHANGKNGLDATQAESTYEFYKSKYGPNPTKP